MNDKIKLYNAVTIYINPESDNFEQVLHEDSFEYKGEMALCWEPFRKKARRKMFGRRKYKAPKLRSKIGEWRTPGAQMLGLPGYQHPEYLPATWGGSIPQYIHEGSQAPGGQSIGANYPSLGVASNRHHFYNLPEYSKDFRQEWYDPYVQKGLVNPLQAIRERGFVEATPGKTGLSSEFLQSIPGITSGPEWAGKRIMAPEAMRGLQFATEGIETAGREKSEALEELDIKEEEADKAKTQAKVDQAILRQQTLAGEGGRQEAARAEAAGTGFAYSAPAEYGVDEAGMGTEQALGEVSKTDRDIQEEYKETLSEIEGGREDVGQEYTQAVSDYGREVGDVLLGTQDEINALIQGAQGLMQSHQQYGSQLGQMATGARTGSPAKWAQYNPNIVGQTTRGAPTGGWFSEAQPPTYQETLDMLSQASTQAGKIAQKTGAEMLPGTGIEV